MSITFYVLFRFIAVPAFFGILLFFVGIHANKERAKQAANDAKLIDQFNAIRAYNKTGWKAQQVKPVKKDLTNYSRY